jgi:peroxidase
MTDLIAPNLVHRMFHTYRTPDDVDLYVGGNFEVPIHGTPLGPTMHCLVRDQFERLKRGDRFFYTNPGQFTPEQLAAIGKVTLSRVMCDSADDPSDMTLPRNVFKVIHPTDNPILSCRDTINIPLLDMEAWR